MSRKYSLVLMVGVIASLVFGGLAVAQTRVGTVKQGQTVRSVVRLATNPAARGQQHLDEPRMLAPNPVVMTALAKVANAPSVDVGVEPLEGDAIVYHLVAGKTSSEAATGQVSVVLGIKNKESKTVTLTKVRLSHAGGSKEIAANLAISPNATKGWQNNRPYHIAGDTLYVNSPLPSTLDIELFFAGFTAPAKLTKALKPYAPSFSPPFKTADLGTDELWESASTHGGGAQVFAYDLGVNAYVDGGWNHLHPGKNEEKNENFRVWGKRIYAMADGEVVHSLNECPENKKPGTSDEDVWEKFPYGGAGNHFYIQHGDVIALYAHMQKGSLNTKLLAKGSKVKKGDFLGLAGNSGSSGGPHLHVHLRKETAPETGPFRPLLFKDAFAIQKAAYPKPGSNVAWSKLAGSGVPGFEGDRSYLWPSSKHPYCKFGSGGLVAKHGIPEADYQKVFDSIWTCGYRPTWVDGFDVGGKTYFNLVFQPEDGAWVARHDLTGAAYQTEFDKWSKAGFKLVNVDSYLKGGAVRYAAVWSKASGPQVAAYHGADDATHQKNFNEWTKDGWTPVNVSVVAPGNKRQITALYQKTNVHGLYAHHALTTSQYKTLFKDYGDKGFKLAYINGFVQNGKPMLSAIWHKKTSYGAYIAKHYLTGSAYQTEFTAQANAGFQIHAVTGYAGDGGARYEGLWVK